MTVYLHSLGCDKNLVDSEVMLGRLYESGHKSVAGPDTADLIVVNTCGFIQDAVEEGIETILKMAEHKKEGARLVVTGCMAKRYRDEILAEIPEVDEIVDSVDITIEEAKRVRTMPLHVAYVKISEGCDNHCTYCTIPMIKGPYRDRKFESIIKECKWLVESGAKELVLVAQDTARYGMALYGRQRLHELLQTISEIDGLGWVRVLYAYPEHIYPELVEAIAGSDKVCKYIDMPIQHSHPDVLDRMGRKSIDLLALVARLRERGITIRTTLIAGFPGETEEEYGHLREFVKQVKFDHLGVFAYSREDGTPAAQMKPQTKAAVKKARQKELMAIQSEIAGNNSKAMVGQVLKIMVDGKVEENVYSGRSQRDTYDVDGAVFFPSDYEWMSGDYVKVKVVKAHGYDLYGELVDIVED